LKVDFQASRVTSDGGLILVRELDERLGLDKLIKEHLRDSRQGLHKQFTLTDLLRHSVYSRLAGYEDLNDAKRLSADPKFRLINSQRIWNRRGADLDLALVRDRAAEKGRISDRADGVEPGDAGAGRVSRWLRPRRARLAEILFRPPGRPSRKPLVRYKSFAHQAGSGTKPRRIVAKVEHHPGELFPRVGIIVTNLSLPSRALVRFYNK
jgi:hypothetical protein